MTKIKGNHDGKGGSNKTYDIGPRKNVLRGQVVKEVEQGMHPDAHVYKLDGKKYPRDNPDQSKQDNVNRK